MVGIAGPKRFVRSSSQPVRQFAKPSRRPVVNPSAYVTSLVLLLLGLGVSAATAQSLFLGSNRTGVWVDATQPASGQLQLGLSYGGSAQRVTFLYQKPGTETWGQATGTPAGGPPGSPNWVSSSMPMTGSIDGTLRVKAEVEPYGGDPITVGPQEFALKNLTVDEIRCEAAQGGGEVVEAGELFMAATGPTTVDYEVDLLDGYECPTEASATLTLKLRPLGVGQQRQATATGPAPTTMTGVFGTSLPIGFYYKEATASEQVTYDTASNLSSFWQASTPMLSGFVWTDTGRGRLTVDVTLSTSEAPTEGEYAWCKPLPTTAGGAVLESPLTSPSVGFAQDGANVTLTWGEGGFLDLSDAGVHRFGMAFRDDREYHAPDLGRWTPPRAVTLTVPSSTHIAGTWLPAPDHSHPNENIQEAEFVDVAGDARIRLGKVRGALGAWPEEEGQSFAYSFYSRLPGETSQVVDEPTTQHFEDLCHRADVIQFVGHGAKYALYLNDTPTGVYTDGDLDANSMTQADLVVLHCCNAGQPNGIAKQMQSYCGARAVIAYAAPIRYDPGVFDDAGYEWQSKTLWEFLVDCPRLDPEYGTVLVPYEPMPVWDAICWTQAKWEWTWPNPPYIPEYWGIQGLCGYGNGSTTLQPAF